MKIGDKKVVIEHRTGVQRGSAFGRANSAESARVLFDMFPPKGVYEATYEWRCLNESICDKDVRIKPKYGWHHVPTKLEPIKVETLEQCLERLGF